MKKIVITLSILVFCAFSSTAIARQPIPITAEEAFDLVQSDGSVALVDVRTRAEYTWVGAACQVDAINTINDRTIFPDFGKVILGRNGRYIEFTINGHYRHLLVKKLASIEMSPISYNIPFELWDEETSETYLNEFFEEEVLKLSTDYGYRHVIFFCRSGGRSESCVPAGSEIYKVFEEVYEIDQPDGMSGMGGFEGTSYSNVYNGYRGFPARETEMQEHYSVSWKDAGLPIKTGLTKDLSSF